MADGREHALKTMAEELARENRRLQIQVLEERLIGLEAQIRLGQAIKEQTEAELRALREQ